MDRATRRNGSYNSPGCLDGGAGCPSAWPSVLWEIQDATDADANGYPDMGESWSKPGLGRICVAKDASGNCTDERYVALFGGGFDRERKNRRGNWFYIVDVETGFVLYKVRSGVANFGSGRRHRQLRLHPLRAFHDRPEQRRPARLRRTSETCSGRCGAWICGT